MAVAWILGCVFVRFLEDNALVDPPRLSGPVDRRRRALDEHNLYFRAHPTDSDREYLLHVFRAVSALPVADQIFDEKHNPVWSLGPSGDAATGLLGLWQRIDPDSGCLRARLHGPRLGHAVSWATSTRTSQRAPASATRCSRRPSSWRSSSSTARSTPAIEEFGFREVRLIDPACGSGHFLLGAFQRLDALWARHEPGTNPRERASRVLGQLAGVDLNPFAAAIARFRLCVAALRASEVLRLTDAPAFELHVADRRLPAPRTAARNGRRTAGIPQSRRD